MKMAKGIAAAAWLLDALRVIRLPSRVDVLCDHKRCSHSTTIEVDKKEILAILWYAVSFKGIRVGTPVLAHDGKRKVQAYTNVELSDAYLKTKSLRDKLAAHGFRVAGTLTFCQSCWDAIGAEKWAWAKELLDAQLAVEDTRHRHHAKVQA
jgi:hypothetical protein